MIFESVPLRQLLLVHYEACAKRGFVVDPSIGAALDATVTMRMTGQKCEYFASALEQSLARMKLVIVKNPGFDMITGLKDIDERDKFTHVVYQPRYRDAIALADMCQIVIRKGAFAHKSGIKVSSGPSSAAASSDMARSADTPGSGASFMAKSVDKLVFFGPPSEVAAVSSLLAQLDTPSAQLEIRVGVYEFSSQNDAGSAVNAALKLFNGRFSISTGTSAVGSVLKITSGSIEAALDLLDTDSRFKYVARPKVLVRDGQPARFFAGEDVRVTGQTTLDAKGNQVQSKETLSAGVTLEVTPRIYEDTVSLDIYQAVSSFIASSGADPTVNKREVRTSLGVEAGAVYVIGGLQSGRKTATKSRFLGWRMSDVQGGADTEVILLLSVARDGVGAPSRKAPEGAAL